MNATYCNIRIIDMTKKWALTMEINIQEGQRVLEMGLSTGYPLLLGKIAHTVYSVKYS